jgi:SCP-2 sterol transfer family
MRFGVFYQVTRARRRGRAWLRNLGGQAGRPRPAVRSARDSLRARGQVGLRRLLDRASDDRLEQIFGSSQAQRAVFGMMTRHFDPAKADGFQGAIVYDLGLADGTRRCWVVEVRDGRARVYQDDSATSPVEALLTVRVPLAGFVRAVTTSESLSRLMLDGRMTMDGDLALADRLPEMFGAGSAH